MEKGNGVGVGGQAGLWGEGDVVARDIGEAHLVDDPGVGLGRQAARVACADDEGACRGEGAGQGGARLERALDVEPGVAAVDL